MQVVSSINNLIIGKIYVDHGGVMRITSSATGMVCKLKFREQGILSRHEAHEVRALLCIVRSHAVPQSFAISFLISSSESYDKVDTCPFGLQDPGIHQSAMHDVLPSAC